MKRIIILCLALPLTLSLAPAVCRGATFAFAGYQTLLDRYLLADRAINDIPVNVIDYRRLKEEQDRPGTAYMRLLTALGDFDPAALSDKNERLAFWINVYNIAAIKTIVDHYPVDSIRSRRINWLKQPWKRKAIKVGSTLYSLHAIEFDVLIEGLRDLRVHLGINCASVSCADLRPEPYRGKILDAQLQEQGERLAAQPEKGLLINRANRRVRISQIFKFDKEHFDAWAGGAALFLLPYISDPQDRALLESGEFTLDYLDYDWKANDLIWADKK